MIYYRQDKEQQHTQKKGCIKMKIYEEKSLANFEFWSGAKDTVKYLTYDELEKIEAILEDAYPEGMSDTQINDIFWFEEDWIAEMLGYSDFEELMHRDDEEEEEEEEEEEDKDENYFTKEPWDV
jgi:hypothetical protein